MNSRNRKIIIGVLALFLVLSVGYALFSETLNINGNATASGNFDLEFTSVGNITKVGYTDVDKIGDSNIAVISNDKNTLTITVNKLDYPGAYVQIPVVITNKGTITGELEAINREDFITSENIKLTYTSVEEIGKIFEPNVSKDMIIRIEWDENINESSEEKLQFKLSLSYKQATNTKGDISAGDVETPETCTAFEKKDTYNVGDVIALCNKETGVSEDFYVVSDNGDTVTMLAKYNLLVGNTTRINDNYDLLSNVPISSSEKGYGVQSDKAKAFLNYNEDSIGTIAFGQESSSYWTNEGSDLLSEYGSSYPADVYSGNILIKDHVDNYVSYLNSIGYNNLSGRLLNLNEAFALGCQEEDKNHYYGNCDSAPNWLKTSTFWLGTALHSNKVFQLFSSNNGYGADDYSVEIIAGIRPVITISKSGI